jgi:hypothetical protein
VVVAEKREKDVTGIRLLTISAEERRGEWLGMREWAALTYSQCLDARTISG